MTGSKTLRSRLAGAGALLAVGVLVAGCGSSASSDGGGSSAAASGSHASGTPAADRALTIAITSGSHGPHLVGPDRRAIYLWEADRGGMSRCSGACAASWPPVIAKSKPSTGAGVKTRDLGLIRRSGGARQVTYAGHPLYYYAGDAAPGQTSGQGSDGFGARWWLVSPSGSAITGGHSSSSASLYPSAGSAASTGSSGSSGGW